MKKRIMIIFLLLVIISFLAYEFLFMTKNNESFSVASLTDEKYLPNLLSSISSANKSVHVIMFDASYYPKRNSSANDILIFLAAARKRNLDVKIIMEGGEAFLGPEFSNGQNDSCSFLKNASIQARFDPKGVTTHAKLIIIDSSVIIIGSTNWNYYALEKNHEASALINSQSAAIEFEDYFSSLWKQSADCSGS